MGEFDVVTSIKVFSTLTSPTLHLWHATSPGSIGMSRGERGGGKTIGHADYKIVVVPDTGGTQCICV